MSCVLLETQTYIQAVVIDHYVSKDWITSDTTRTHSLDA